MCCRKFERDRCQDDFFSLTLQRLSIGGLDPIAAPGPLGAMNVDMSIKSYAKNNSSVYAGTELCTQTYGFTLAVLVKHVWSTRPTYRFRELYEAQISELSRTQRQHKRKSRSNAFDE